jgi:hypothetical protein
MEYTVAPGEYGRYVQQPGRPFHLAEGSMLNLQSTDGYSSYLCYERTHLSIKRSYKGLRTKN